MGQNKLISIELLKFIAVIIVANSHMEVLYGPYSYFATGGAIGDALFFFASGFTLFLGGKYRFDNWYKRRISRIYPSIIAWAIIQTAIGTRHLTMTDVVLGGGEWFIQCILVFYIVLYFIRWKFESKPLIPFILSTTIVIVWYCCSEKTDLFMYGWNYFRWSYFFLFMLMGAYFGNGTYKTSFRPFRDIPLLIGSILSWYGMLYFCERSEIMCSLQILSIIPLMGIVLAFYNICNSPQLASWCVGWKRNVVLAVSGLCLESYIVQMTVYSDKLNGIFPFNIPIYLLLVLLAAYCVRTFGRIILQTFQTTEYNWRNIFELY